MQAHKRAAWQENGRITDGAAHPREGVTSHRTRKSCERPRAVRSSYPAGGRSRWSTHAPRGGAQPYAQRGEAHAPAPMQLHFGALPTLRSKARPIRRLFTKRGIRNLACCHGWVTRESRVGQGLSGGAVPFDRLARQPRGAPAGMMLPAGVCATHRLDTRAGPIGARLQCKRLLTQDRRPDPEFFCPESQPLNAFGPTAHAGLGDLHIALQHFQVNRKRIKAFFQPHGSSTLPESQVLS
jgi:hypothetical protein